MTSEVAILRAYALATQGRYADAENLLKSADGVLNTPAGADLLARIRFEQGDEDSARHIWERILYTDPTNESAKKSLDALDNPPIDEECGDCFFNRWKYALAAALAVLIGVSFSIGKACRKVETRQPQSTQQTPDVIAEQTLEVARINGKVLTELRDGILTNMTEKTMLVISGGRGKYATDRMLELASIADSLRMMSHIPLSQISLRLHDTTSECVNIRIISPYDGK